MRQGTTPTIQITINDIDLNEMQNIYVVFEQNGYILKKESSDLDIEGNTISVSLSQEETLNFKEGTCNIQLRMITKGGVAIASPIKTTKVYRVLNKEVIT
jgi:hypothetical protein|uniref:Uncharacterized protein n=1 Tax=Siphoviridae sp. ct0D87 TaxID=2827760 RepID=A0A8S5SB42_9CAUD|nr:MAG TPA: hypothetical protein [Siphoviridae sp. ct0D87]DAH63161.1 MAG TPA: hypothetical protein [Caudoviricetes sp.]DAP70043.1 MAG TPA: hypothetical protein [Caudoviricetes sp.]